MEVKNQKTTREVEMGDWGTLDEPGVLFADGLGPCIGLCLAYKTWGGIIHTVCPHQDGKEISELIAEAKKAIPPEKVHLIRPVLCGSDPGCEEKGDPKEWKLSAIESRQEITQILSAEGFGEPLTHWSAPGQIAGVLADLEHGKIVVEIDDTDTDTEFPILQD